MYVRNFPIGQILFSPSTTCLLIGRIFFFLFLICHDFIYTMYNIERQLVLLSTQPFIIFIKCFSKFSESLCIAVAIQVIIMFYIERSGLRLIS